MADWKTIRMLTPSDAYCLPGEPQFLGYIPQRFRVYRSEIAANYAQMVPLIEKEIHNSIVNVLRRENPTSVASSNGWMLGQVQDFGRLAMDAQEQGLPIDSVVAAGNVEDRKREAVR